MTPEQAPTNNRRQARLLACRDCAAAVLVGLDGDTMAVTAFADPHPLDTLGELTAILAGRPTYDVHDATGTIQLQRRDPFTIAARRRRPVIASHSCPGRQPTDLTWLPGRNQPDNGNDPQEPPF